VLSGDGVVELFDIKSCEPFSSSIDCVDNSIASFVSSAICVSVLTGIKPDEGFNRACDNCLQGAVFQRKVHDHSEASVRLALRIGDYLGLSSSPRVETFRYRLNFVEPAAVPRLDALVRI